MFRYILFIVAGICIGSLAAGQQTVFNDPNAQVRAAKNFHAIEVSNGINLYLSQGNEEVVAVSAEDPKNRDRLRTEVKDGVLKIWYEKEGWNWDHGHRKLKAYVSCKTLDKLVASGASNVLVSGGLSGKTLDLRLSGASDFSGSVKFDELHLDQTGASDASIQGVAPVVSIEASGASDVKGYDLITENCSVRASGASDIHIYVNKELNAHASGASNIYYKGTAVLREFHSSGASNISKKG
jgi:hypothetical protein